MSIKNLGKILIGISVFLVIIFNSIGIYELINKYEELEQKIINHEEKLNLEPIIIKEIDADINILLNSSVSVTGIFSEGAGTVIKKTDNNMYILTCAHVVEEIIRENEKGNPLGASVGYTMIDDNGRLLGVVFYGASIIKYDETTDLALLKTFIVDDNLIAVNIASEEPQKGDVVYSVGSPLGLIRTVSKGILSNKEDGFYISDNTITFGNSGGGLYNIKNELIGVPARVLVYQIDDANIVPESGLGLSITLQIIKEFLEGVDY